MDGKGAALPSYVHPNTLSAALYKNYNNNKQECRWPRHNEYIGSLRFNSIEYLDGVDVSNGWAHGGS